MPKTYTATEVRNIVRECLEEEIVWKYKKGYCTICDHLEHSGEAHYCEENNSFRSQALEKLEKILAGIKRG